MILDRFDQPRALQLYWILPPMLIARGL